MLPLWRARRVHLCPAGGPQERVARRKPHRHLGVLLLDVVHRTKDALEGCVVHLFTALVLGCFVEGKVRSNDGEIAIVVALDLVQELRLLPLVASQTL